MTEWDEDAHPRDEEGKFTDSGGSSSSSGKTGVRSWAEKTGKTSSSPARVIADARKHEEAHSDLKRAFGDNHPKVKELEDAYSTEHVAVEHTRVAPNPYGDPYHHFTLRDRASGKEIGTMARSFGTDRSFDKSLEGKPMVWHGSMKIAPEYQGKGVGAAILGKSLSLYEKLGIHHVGLSAAEVGRYTWASFGFRPRTINHLSSLERSLERRGVPKEEVKRISTELKDKPWEVAAFRLNGEHVGKEAFLNSGGYEAYLRLDPKDEGYQHAKRRLGF